MRDVARKVLLPWYNACKFFTTYAAIDKWSVETNTHAPETILDRWLVSRCEGLKDQIDQHMTAYRLDHVVPALLHFIEELTNCYVRLNRNRFWASGLAQDKCAAYSTLHTVLQHFAQLMAPFAPFLLIIYTSNYKHLTLQIRLSQYI